MATKFMNANSTGSEFSIWEDTAATNTVVKVSTVACNLRGFEVNNTSGNPVYLRMAENADATSATLTEYMVRVANSAITRCIIPGGQAMTALSYWVTRNPTDGDNVAPSGSVTVRLLFV